MPAFGKLVFASGCMHVSDQIALVSVPIIAALVFDASPQLIGVLVACQSLAHLLGSLPLGMWVDRGQLNALARLSITLSTAGFVGAAIAVSVGAVSGMAITITAAGFGMVLYMLTSLSILPQIKSPNELASSNATLDLSRTLPSLVVPLFIGYALTADTASTALVIAALSSGLALVAFRGFPLLPANPRSRDTLSQRLTAGATFVAKNPLLRAIALCATFWNFAFSALMVVAIPLLVDRYGAEASAFGTAMAAFGLGGVAGSWTMHRFSTTLAPNTVLLFGPASSLAAAAVLLTGHTIGLPAVMLGFFFLGYGPSMWLAVQNTVRQLVSPADMLGRVNAVIQTSIYGVRPLGALAGGGIAGAFGATEGMVCVVLGFFLSLAAAVFSDLRAVHGYDTLNTSGSAFIPKG